ncbi:MAG: hypothetical protein JJT94_16930 [Bernardetiaceae bacterium]|nr:hypothetical protein [Bernardetiaceae bacterium]
MLLLLAVFVFGLSGCQEEREILLNSNKAETTHLKIDFNRLHEITKNEAFNKLSDDLWFIEGQNILLNPVATNTFSSNTETIVIETSEVSQENLNELFTLDDQSKIVLAVTLLEDDNENYDGLLIHFSDADGNLKLEAFHRENLADSTFEKVDFPANLVTAFKLDNILYMARAIFPKRNIITYGSSAISSIIPTNTYDDIDLLHFASAYNLFHYQSALKEVRDPSDTLDPNDPESPGGGSRPCAIAVHHCMSGDSRRINCQPLIGGCVPPICNRWEALMAAQAYQMTNEYELIESNLIEDSLYNFRDWLYEQPKGRLYHDGYYHTSEHFKESLDIELIYDLASTSLDMSEFVSAIMNDNLNYILTQSDFDKFVGIAQKSAQKSQSSVYKYVMSAMISEAQIYKNQNVQQIKILLSE